MTRADRIQTILATRFTPEHLVVSDDSDQHVGHAGAAPGGQTHYTVTMVAPGFAGLNRVARTRLVNEALAAEFASGLHALVLKLKAPGEA